MTADMTFDANEPPNHEKSFKYDIPAVDHTILDDDSDSTKSADVSHISGKPISGYY
jgi:hypothetical protein